MGKEKSIDINPEKLADIVECLEGVLDDLKNLTGEKSPEKAEEAKIEVGSKVKWDDKEGEVLKIKGDVATVEDDDDEEEHKVDLDDLELVIAKKSELKSGKEGKKEAKIEVGSEVEWEDKDGDSHEGEVLKIKGDVATVEDDDGEEHKVDLDDLELA